MTPRREPVRQYTPEWRDRYGTPGMRTRPEWSADLEHELVAASVASWDGRGGLIHPSNIALVVERFLADLDPPESA